MATIHHAVVKSAASKGVTLEVSDQDGFAVEATIGERTFSLPVEPDGDEPTQAEYTEVARDVWNNRQQAADFEAEYPGVTVDQDGEDYVGFDKDGEEIARDPDLDDLFTTLREAVTEDTDGDTDDEDEEPESRSVVPDRYKKEYAERGHPAHCGDWLAVTLNGFCLGETGSNLTTLTVIAEANGVDTARYSTNRTNGWQGRFRMTVRNVLAKLVATAGVLHVPAEASGENDLELQAPAAWIAEHLPKAKGKAAVAK